MVEHPSHHWLTMATRITEAAAQRQLYSDFQHEVRMSIARAGESSHDYWQVIRKLVQTSVIGFEETEFSGKRLVLNSLREAEWLDPLLAEGNSLAWQIAETVDPKGQRAKKFDSDKLADIGRRGEEAVLAALRDAVDIDHHKLIRHVSEEDDTLGYDIRSPSVSGHRNQQLLEVKTTVRPQEKFRFYLSRNEYRVGKNNTNWAIVFVRLRNSTPIIEGFIRADQLLGLMPRDASEEARWQTAEIELSTTRFTPGLP